MISIAIKKVLHGIEGKMEFDFELKITPGSFTAIYGNSGAGKTSLLRMISGLMIPDSGKIMMGGVAWFNKSAGINLSVKKRNAAFVFQDLALFPNMTVLENLKFSSTDGNNGNMLNKAVQIMELEKLIDRPSTSLSGGQQQRVALARAILQKPDILLLDEPLSALDQTMQFKLQEYILKSHKEFNLTTIMVSHSVSQIVKMADHVVLLENGMVTKSGTPSRIFGQAQLSGKVQFTGEVISIDQEDVVEIATVLIGKDFVKVVITGSEKFEVGDTVLISAKAFNPIIQKVQTPRF